jgi:hypothetical protein
VSRTTRTSDELERDLFELEASYKVAATAARRASLHGQDAAPHWRACQSFFRMAQRARTQLLLAEWSAS